VARGAIRDVLVGYLVVTVLTAVATRMPGTLGDNAPLVVAALFLVTAVRYAQRSDDGMTRYGIDLGGVLVPPADDSPTGLGGVAEFFRILGRALPKAARELGVALATGAIIFPPFAIGFWLYHGPAHPFRLRAPADVGSFVLSQLVVAALPEELFFRGFVQTRLTDASPRTVKLLGAQVSPVALVGQATLFALVHYAADASPARLAVFFPALVFGWLRAWRGGVGAAIFFHAMCNVYVAFLEKGWS